MPSFFPSWVVITHFLNIFFMLLLARSGLEVLSAFPKLYWNDDCTPGREWVRFSRKVRTSSITPTQQASDVRARLERYRRDLYGGRGPGIGENELPHNTRLRRRVGGECSLESRTAFYFGRSGCARLHAKAAVNEGAALTGGTSDHFITTVCTNDDHLLRSLFSLAFSL